MANHDDHPTRCSRDRLTVALLFAADLASRSCTGNWAARESYALQRGERGCVKQCGPESVEAREGERRGPCPQLHEKPVGSRDNKWSTLVAEHFNRRSG